MRTHADRLISIFDSAPINQTHFKGIQLTFPSGSVEIQFTPDATFFHAMGSGHGSLAFKLLDDAAYFAAQFGETEFSLLTARFQIQIQNTIPAVPLIARGVLLENNSRLWLAESTLWDDSGKILAKGSGSFLKGKIRLAEVPGYG